jgi:hypothetical protein
MASIRFLGAAGTVTGSGFLVEASPAHLEAFEPDS